MKRTLATIALAASIAATANSQWVGSCFIDPRPRSGMSTGIEILDTEPTIGHPFTFYAPPDTFVLWGWMFVNGHWQQPIPGQPHLWLQVVPVPVTWYVPWSGRRLHNGWGERVSIMIPPVREIVYFDCAFQVVALHGSLILSSDALIANIGDTRSN